MPNHKSSEKRIRTSERRRLRNKAKKTRMKSMIKELKASPSQETALELYKKVSSHLDRISSHGIIHKKNAARKKSRLAKFIKKLGTQA